jgi:hypothetical protein
MSHGKNATRGNGAGHRTGIAPAPHMEWLSWLYLVIAGLSLAQPPRLAGFRRRPLVDAASGNGSSVA